MNTVVKQTTADTTGPEITEQNTAKVGVSVTEQNKQSAYITQAEEERLVAFSIVQWVQEETYQTQRAILVSCFACL